ncbi:putative ABC transport system ATP-binding protein [Thermomonospora echinospora]|uniref:Putative ABC transport system ATP-binding protein n=1 Tax=Thermomonospora echinospora TaxID=1992 RepID=A0A1H6C8S0_9ACTN|nr:ABC transporter ATP-binding protein [Thermomonospora echinospora]SEG69292.1 putative ABC transport system ATP-binding protein [Thermomonospora echinospora]
MPPVRKPADPAVRLDSVSRTYGRGPAAFTALREVSLDVPRGAFTAVMGPSGSGKSTLLHCAAGLDRVGSGRVWLGGVELTGMGETALTELRRERVGFVFQAFNLVPALTVAQNVTLPLRMAGVRVERARVAQMLERVGLAGRAGHRPGMLSGGQQQRVAIARALVTRPEVVFADEPTGALDTVTAREILDLLREAADDLGQTVVMVTHDPVAAAYADTVLFLADGRIADVLERPGADRIAGRMTTLGARA